MQSPKQSSIQNWTHRCTLRYGTRKYRYEKGNTNVRNFCVELGMFFLLPFSPVHFPMAALGQWEILEPDHWALVHKPNTTLSLFHGCCWAENTLTKGNTQRGAVAFQLVPDSMHFIIAGTKAAAYIYIQEHKEMKACTLAAQFPFHSYSSRRNPKMAPLTFRMSLSTSADPN